MTRRMAIMAGCLLWAAGLQAQWDAGDIAFVAYNTDDTDDFAWVALRTIPANTTICFTDSSVSNGWYRWTEHLGDIAAPGPLRWTHTNAVSAGTVIRWVGGTPGSWTVGLATGGRLNLSSDGDQLVAYRGAIARDLLLPSPWQGNPADAVALHALNFANAGWDNAAGGDSQTSFVPPGLSVPMTAVHVGNYDNAYYDGPTEGTAKALLVSIADPANWRGSNEMFRVFAWSGDRSFSVKPDGTVLSVW